MHIKGLLSALFLAGALIAGESQAQVEGPGAGLPGAPEFLSSGEPSTRQLELHYLQQQYLSLRRQQSELQAKLRQARETFTDGSPAVMSALKALEANQKELETVKQRLDEESERSKRDHKRSALLMTRVSLDLQNATVRQAAEALGQATRIPITVDDQVPPSLRLSVRARGITLGAVLEAIARQASLKVAPADGGVAITTWPMVDVDGQTQIFKGPWAPWATEWGQLPGTLSTNGWSFPGEPGGAGAAPDPSAMVAPVPGGSGFPPGGGAPGGYPGMASGQPAAALFPGGSSAGGATPRERSATLSGAAATASSLTALGDRQIALAEPGRGPTGQLGVWVSVYRLEGTQLKKIATAFHALKSDSGGIGTPGMGGMPGAGDSIGVGGMPGAGGSPFGGGGALDLTPSSQPLGSGSGKPGFPTPPKAKPKSKK